MSIEGITNPLEYIECIIALDCRDWTQDSRLTAIYAIVFGWDDESYEELKKKYHWSDEGIKRLKDFHKEWMRLRTDETWATGRWENKTVFDADDGHIDQWQSAQCSVCGKYHTTPYLYYFDWYKYCPNCGAKMDGGETE